MGLHCKAKKKKILSLTLMVLGMFSLGHMVTASEVSGKTNPVYTLEGVTVEAKRPDWESKLSPGTVTVIRPEKYKGEQKTLADLLKDVPGVHVREVNGKGQYTTVSVRGSTAAQVGVFVDGVMTNLGGDAAVDISTIPVKNVERVEVYRGYIPSRFGGTFIGGVINIVTKRPTKTHISAEVGAASFGGCSASLEMTKPLGSGSLLAGINYEAADGNFPYYNYAVIRGKRYALDMLENTQKEIQDNNKSIERTKNDTELTPDDKKNLLKEYQDYEKELEQKLKEDKYRIEVINNGNRYRRYNDRKNTDVILKWQNPNWMIKGTYKRINRHMPDGVWGGNVVTAPAQSFLDIKDTYYASARRQKIDSKEILIQHRQERGRIEWGWRIDYLHQNKNYHVGHKLEYPKSFHWKNYPLREWSEYKSNKYNIQIDGTYKLNDRHMVEFMTNASQEKMNIDGSKMDVLLDGTMGKWIAQTRNRYKQDIFNLQAQDSITLDKKGSLIFTPSIRYNCSKITGYSDSKRFNKEQKCHFTWIHPEDSQVDGKWTWQLALKKAVNNNLTLRATGGTYFRLLNMYEIAGDGAGILPAPAVLRQTESSDLIATAVFPRPEYGRQFDLGVLWNGKLFRADNVTKLTYFWRGFDSMLQLYRAGLDFWCYYNDNKGRGKGFELQSNFIWKKFSLDVELTYTKMDMQRRNSSVGYDYTDVWAVYQPEWEGALRLTWAPNKKFVWFNEIQYTGEYFTYYGKSRFGEHESYLIGKSTPALCIFNTGIKWQPIENLQVTIGCNDVFNKASQLKLWTGSEPYGSGYVNPDFVIQGRTYFSTVRYAF